jgi:hypothetical protein
LQEHGMFNLVSFRIFSLKLFLFSTMVQSCSILPGRITTRFDARAMVGYSILRCPSVCDA